MRNLNRIFLIILLLLSFNLKSQNEWAPTGATWYFTKPLLNYPSEAYTRFTSTGDTTIEGHSCKIIEMFIPFDFNGNQVNYSSNLFTYIDSNKVYISYDSTFSLLYDFNKNENEYWINERENDTVFVDSTGLIQISGKTFKTQYIHNSNNWYLSFSGLVIEAVGWTGYFYPYDGDFAPPEGGPLRCYDDDSISYHLALHCDSVALGINEHLQEQSILNAYPNPTRTQLNVSYNGNTDILIEVLNTNGQIIYKTRTDKSLTLDLTRYLPGVYLLKATGERLVTFDKIIKL